MSAPVRLLIHFLATLALVWVLDRVLSQYFVLTGGWQAMITVAALITLMNILVRPVLAIVTLPLKFFAHILTLILVNAVFLYLTLKIVDLMDTSFVLISIEGGVVGWVVVSLIFGFVNWALKDTLHGKGARS